MTHLFFTPHLSTVTDLTLNFKTTWGSGEFIGLTALELLPIDSSGVDGVDAEDLCTTPLKHMSSDGQCLDLTEAVVRTEPQTSEAVDAHERYDCGS